MRIITIIVGFIMAGIMVGISTHKQVINILNNMIRIISNSRDINRKDISRTLNIIIHHMGNQPSIIAISILNLTTIHPIRNTILTSKQEKSQRKIKKTNNIGNDRY